jgi:hypothetical protein
MNATTTFICLLATARRQDVWGTYKGRNRCQDLGLRLS